MINTQLYGIHSPKNFHSFQNTWKIVFLQPCQACSARILPLTPACECLRCGCLAHRKCIESLPTCAFFTFEKSPSRGDGKDGEPVKKSRGKSKTKSITDLGDRTANDMHFDSIFELKLEEIIEKACSIPAVLGYVPEIKSPFCIWRTLLRAIVMRQTTDLNRVAAFCNPDDSSTTIESKVRICLSDLDGFAGQLFVCCFYVFLSLNAIDTQELAVHHGRECLDTIVDGLLCICNDEVTQDARIVRTIIVAVEKFVFHEQNGAFYEKIFQYMARESLTLQLNTTFRDAHYWPESNWKEFNKYGTAIRMKHCPKEKLVIFVVFLQLITEATAAPMKAATDASESPSSAAVSQLYIAELPAEEEATEQRDGSDPSGGGDGGNVVADGADRSGPENLSSGDAAGVPSELSPEVPERHSKPLRREDINADKLIELLGCIIQRQQAQGVCNWIAEYLFLSSELVSTDSVDSMAAEGYALATLQQCMSILLHEEAL